MTTNTGPITIAFAGPGDSNFANTADLLNDWLGFGEEDKDGFYAPSDREITVILPVTSEQLESDGFKNVLDWTEKADLPFTAVTDDSKGRKVTRVLDDADETHKVANVEAKIISLLKEAKGEAVLVALWGDDEEIPEVKYEFAERLLSLAEEADIPAKDLCAGLDDLSFADEGAADEPPAADPEPEPEPEEAPRRRRGRAAAPVEEEVTPEEEPLTEEDVKPEPVEEKPKRTRRTRAQIEADEAAAAEAKEDKAAESLKANAKEAAETLRKQESAQVEPTTNPWSQIKGPFPTSADLEHRFAFHAATTEEKRNAHTSVREACLALAKFIDETLPDGREKSSAITKVEEAMFWANAGLARQNTATAEPLAAPETASQDEGGTETQEEGSRRGRGRPRKDGTPAQPRTEDDLKVAFYEDEDGSLRRRGRGRPRKGETVVELTPSEVKEAEAEGRIAA